MSNINVFDFFLFRGYFIYLFLMCDEIFGGNYCIIYVV